MEELDKRIAELSPAKRALLEQRLKASSASQIRAQKIEPRAKQSSAAVSFAQERLWFLDQLEENRALYNVPRALRLVGPLKVEALRCALNELISRHEPFRTHFDFVDGVLHQIVAEKSEIDLIYSDLSKLTPNERERQANQIRETEARRPFDLAHGPVIRASLLKLSEQDHILLLTTHHIVSDAWSAGILFNELGELYNAFSEGRPPQLQPLPIQYADFAEWQRTWLDGEVLERQLSYWKSKLQDVTGILDLPTDHPRTAARRSQGAYRFLTVSEAVSDGLVELSKREGATLFMTLLAAFQILLWRYSDQDDIVVGSPIAGRNREEIENLIGFFVNTLALRVDLSGDPTFRGLLEQVRETALAAYAHQDLPFEKLVEELQPERDLGRNPIFQVMFQFQNTSPAKLRLKELEVSKVDTFTETAKFDLTLGTYQRDGELKCVMEYNAGLFTSATIERMLTQYGTLLESIVANPECRISSLPLMKEADERQVLVDWNNTHSTFPRAECIHEIFQQRATSAPDNVALVFGDERITYRQLNHRANRVANYLRERGVGAEIPVAICVERSVDMLVGLLAILKAGGAYVPVEPTNPAERISFILEDCQAPLVLTQHRLTDLFSSSSVDTVYLDGDLATITGGSFADPIVPTTADNAAHVIYTSGSTGLPKGVVSAHRASVNRFNWMWQAYPFAADEVCCQKTSLSFVDSIWEIFGPLLQGVPLVIIPDEVVKDPLRFIAALSVNKVTRLVLVPSLLRVILELGQESLSLLGNLRYCVCSGEKLPVELANLFRERLPNANLINLFGSSEVAADVTCYEVGDTECLTNIPIGRPISNTQIYILNSNSQPAPAGATGEICVGGEGLARGYLNRAKLTAEKFVPNPFSKNAGERLFRTGDIGRYLPDGNVEYRGRRDHQVKVRGFRVELGEIEAQLASHQLINQVVVVALDERGEKELVAYICVTGEAPTINELRAHLRRKLPDYMIPSTFVFLDTFPLTASRKINRLALPRPNRAELAGGRDLIAPRTPTEEILAAIWAELLDVPNVGVLDDFFALGGHSLMLVRVASRIRESFQVDLPLRSLFEVPTLAALAESIDVARRTAAGLEDVPLMVGARNSEQPLSFSQERLWVFEQLESNTGAYNIPRVLRLKGPLDTTALNRSVNSIIERHEVLRTSFLNVNGKPALSTAKSLTLSIPLIDLRSIPTEERDVRIRDLAARETQQPFDLTRSPLLRLTLFRLAEHEHILVLTMHHLISDAWSIRLFMRELAACYNAFTAGMNPSLSALPVQYADFAAWQRKVLSGAVLENQLVYWRHKLDGAPPVIDLPIDRPRPANRSFNGARRAFIIKKEIVDKLRIFARSERATLFMTLLAAFQSLLSCLTDEKDIVVGSPVAGRNRPECEDLIGYFINTLVLRVDFSGDPTFVEILGRVRETALGALANQDVPFEKLVEDLNPIRAVGYNPLFQVWFVLQDALLERQELNGLTVESLECNSVTTRHDLQLSLWETANGLNGAFTYTTALFEAETIVSIVEQFKALLAVISEQPEIRLSALNAVVKAADVNYREQAIATLEEMSRQSLKSTKRRSVISKVTTAVEESWTNPNP